MATIDSNDKNGELRAAGDDGDQTHPEQDNQNSLSGIEVEFNSRRTYLSSLSSLESTGTFSTRTSHLHSDRIPSNEFCSQPNVSAAVRRLHGSTLNENNNRVCVVHRGLPRALLVVS